MASLPQSTRGLALVPISWSVFSAHDDGEAPDEQRWVVTRGNAPPHGNGWAPFKLSGAVAQAALPSIAHLTACLLAGELVPPARSPAGFTLEYVSPDPDAPGLPPWWIKAPRVHGRRLIVCQLYDEQLARTVLQRLGRSHLTEVRGVFRALDRWLAADDSRDLAADPLAQALLESLRQYGAAHPGERLWAVDLRESTELAARVLRTERLQRRRAVRSKEGSR